MKFYHECVSHMIRLIESEMRVKRFLCVWGKWKKKLDSLNFTIFQFGFHLIHLVNFSFNFAAMVSLSFLPRKSTIKWCNFRIVLDLTAFHTKYGQRPHFDCVSGVIKRCTARATPMKKSFTSPFAFLILSSLPSSLWFSLYWFCSTLHLFSPFVRCLNLPHVIKPSTSQTNLQFEKAHIFLQIVCFLFLSMTINLFSLLRSSNNQNVSRFQLHHWFESRSRSDICALRMRFGCEVISCGLFVGGSKNLYFPIWHFFSSLSRSLRLSPSLFVHFWISLLWKSQFDSIRTLLFYVFVRIFCFVLFFVAYEYN